MAQEAYMNKDVFEQDIRGFLFYVETLFDGTERAKLIFDYGQQALYKLREGDIIAVESFSSLIPHDGGIYYTLLEITRIEPTHITIDRLKKYKFMGAVREFLKETTTDFEENDPRVIRDHVYISVDAVKTGYLMKVDKGDPFFISESSKPILGRDAGVLQPKIVGQLLNKGIEKGLVVGNIHSNYEEKKKIEVLVRPNRLVTHHFTIFGFTGSGKSNISSGILSKMIRNHKINSIIFDLSDEYTALMADVLQDEGFLIVNRDDLPDTLIDYFVTGKGNLDDLAKDLAIKTKKPGVFDSKIFEDTYQKVFRKLLDDKRIKVLDTSESGIAEELDFIKFMIKLKDRCSGAAPTASKFEQLDPVLRVAMRNDKTIKKDEMENFKVDNSNLVLVGNIFNGCFQQLGYPTDKYAPAIVREVTAFLAEVRARLELTEGKKLNENFVDINWILNTFVAKQTDKKKLGIIISSEKEILAALISDIINTSLRLRRRSGTKAHDVLFVVDEGHEFLPNPMETGLSPSERTCSRIIERLTRMGRKYGLGVCIASQRIAHLNTTALSNCHTTFLGALPRKYDRDTMNEAYAISPEVLNRVVTFPSGNWYVVSSGAMGINNVPIWITAPNREKELAEFFKNQKYLEKESEKVLNDNGLL